MIYDALCNLACYAGKIRYTAEILDFLKNHSVEDLQPGSCEILGNRLIAKVQAITTQPIPERRWESHQDYADLQVTLRGVEAHGTKYCAQLPEATESHPERDTWYHGDDGEPFGLIVVREKEFAFFAPGELHRPCCAAGEPAGVLKVIFKIRYAD